MKKDQLRKVLEDVKQATEDWHFKFYKDRKDAVHPDDFITSQLSAMSEGKDAKALSEYYYPYVPYPEDYIKTRTDNRAERAIDEQRKAFIKGFELSGEGEGEKVGLHIWDAIDGSFEEVDTLEDARKWVRENYSDPDEGLHPDIESIEIFKKVGQVVLKQVEGKDTFKVTIEPLPTSGMPEGERPINSIHCECPNCKTLFDITPPVGTKC